MRSFFHHFTLLLITALPGTTVMSDASSNGGHTHGSPFYDEPDNSPSHQLSRYNSAPPIIDSYTEYSLPSKTAKIAIIIDDLGYNLQQGTVAAKFPAPLTLAIIPHSPNGAAVAELGHQKGKEIMLHAPMSNLQQIPLDEGGLTENMQHHSFVKTLNNSLNSIPHVIGVNNHMGSFLTQLEEPMDWLMAELAKEELFFIDSRTTPDSVAYEVALNHQLASRKRDVFLDNERDEEYITSQFDKLLAIARVRGNAIAIGHPHPETLAVLARVLPTLKQQGIELISISKLLQQFPAAISPTEPQALPSTKLIGANSGPESPEEFSTVN